jgi:hypothetical protein
MTTQSNGLRGVMNVLKLVKLVALSALALTPTLALAQSDNQWDSPEWQAQGNTDGHYDAQQPYQEQAQAQMAGYNFYGAHPVPYDQVSGQSGGFCNIESRHQHSYPVFDQHLFRDLNGYANFIGDPADFGMSGAGYMYAGHHPLDHQHGGGHCYMSWAHRHLFAPVGVQFVLQGGAYSYTGSWSQDYYANRLNNVNYYDGYYRRSYFGGRYFAQRPAHNYAGWNLYRPRGYVTPVYRAPAPYYRGPAQVYGAPAPYYRAPAPVYRAPAPVYRAPAPVYRAPAPVYRAPAPYYRAPAPVYRAPAPVYRAPAYGGQVHHGYSPAPHYSAPVGGRPAPSFQAHYGRR